MIRKIKEFYYIPEILLWQHNSITVTETLEFQYITRIAVLDFQNPVLDFQISVPGFHIIFLD